MTKKWIALLASTAAGLLFSVAALAASGGPVQQAGNDLSDQASLQRGATAYMNYCSGCHSLKFLRYQRMAEDLGLTEEEVMGNLNFTGAKYGEHIQVAMRNADGTAWFGNAPPDLSLISRVRGSDWIYTYLKSFYLDESRPLGWNNTVFPNASMPNPLWEMQGLQHPQFGAPDGNGERPVTGLVVTKLDGTAKGGVVFALAREFGIPIRFAGIGERPEDLRVFDPEAFVDALLPEALGTA